MTDPSASNSSSRTVKCLVWDLDDTLWHGTLLEDGRVELREGARQLIEALDARGILQSIASKNDQRAALAKLEELGLAQYFLFPQINWNPKSESVKAIARALNVGIDSLAFMDDQAFERDEVTFACPEVLTLHVERLADVLDMPAMTPRFITDDSSKRRQLYLDDARRNHAQEEFSGSNNEFLSTLRMLMTITRATEADLKRAEELTVRTHQLNTTGYTFGYEELDALRRSPDHLLLIAGLDDVYGSYGKIGLALVETRATTWTIRLLLMSCRVMSRGVGGVMVSYIRRCARDAGVELRAEFRETSVNRLMYVTYRFAGFREIARDGASVLLQADLSQIAPYPDHVEVHEPSAPFASSPEYRAET